MCRGSGERAPALLLDLGNIVQIYLVPFWQPQFYNIHRPERIPPKRYIALRNRNVKMFRSNFNRIKYNKMCSITASYERMTLAGLAHIPKSSPRISKSMQMFQAKA